MNRPGSWFRRTPLLLVTALVACGGGGSDPSGPVTGSLAVAVSGLPGGASAAVSVSGPGGFARSLTDFTNHLQPRAGRICARRVERFVRRYGIRPDAREPDGHGQRGRYSCCRLSGIRDRHQRPHRQHRWPAPRHLGRRDGDRAGWLLPEPYCDADPGWSCAGYLYHRCERRLLRQHRLQPQSRKPDRHGRDGQRFVGGGELQRGHPWVAQSQDRWDVSDSERADLRRVGATREGSRWIPARLRDGQPEQCRAAGGPRTVLQQRDARADHDDHCAGPEHSALPG